MPRPGSLVPVLRALLILAALALGLSACGGGGRTSGPTASQTCTVSERVAFTPGLLGALANAGFDVRLTPDAAPQQTRVAAERLVLAATAGNPGTQSGGTNTATDTTINNFCGTGLAGPGATVTTNTDSGNSTTAPAAATP